MGILQRQFPGNTFGKKSKISSYLTKTPLIIVLITRGGLLEFDGIVFFEKKNNERNSNNISKRKLENTMHASLLVLTENVLREISYLSE